MRSLDPRWLVVIGFFLVLFGFVAPFLMVIGIIPLSYLVSFLSFSASVAGLFLGLIGVCWYSSIHRN
jgi:hypothetical protein